MSIQEVNLLAIAEAIREKEGSTGAIPAEDFAARVLALQDSPYGYSMPLRLEVNPGASVTAQNGEDVLTGTADEAGNLTFLLPKPGTWTVTAALEGKEKTVDVTVEDCALNFLSRLPDGYQEVEYIHSDGNCGFNTGCYARLNSTRILLDMEADEYAAGTKQEYIIFGPSASGASVRYFYLIRLSKTQINMRFYQANTKSLTKSIANQRMTIDWNCADGYVDVGGDLLSVTPVNYTFPSTFSLMKPSNSTSFNSIMAKVYSLKIYEGGEIVRDFVPCINPDGVAGMYDMVVGEFYTSTTGGTFTAGPAV